MGRCDAETETLIPTIGCVFDEVARSLRAEGFDASEDGTGRGTPLVPVAFHPTQDPISSTDGSTNALGCGSKGGQASVAVTYPINTQIALRHEALGERTGLGIGSPDDPGFTLQAGHSHAVAVQASQSGVRVNDTVGTLDANYGSRRHNGVMQHMAVRRLTPTECERLQGFPDGYTMIPWKKKPAEDCPDGPRYKALGNSMAVPVMRWIGKRILEVLA